MNIKIFCLLVLITVYTPLPAAFQVTYYQQDDSLNTTLSDSIDSLIEYQSDYLNTAEIEHQKLMRNIFALGFVFMMVLLVVTVFFYGSKIKKVSNVIIMQNEVLTSTKDQLIKIINLFNYIDRQIFITDAKGIIEWHNVFASSWFKEDYEKNRISLLNKFSNENQGIVFQAINESKMVQFEDNLFEIKNNWRVITLNNSKDEFSNLVFIGVNIP